jgi:hypothetical protein
MKKKLSVEKMHYLSPFKVSKNDVLFKDGYAADFHTLAVKLRQLTYNFNTKKSTAEAI